MSKLLKELGVLILSAGEEIEKKAAEFKLTESTAIRYNLAPVRHAADIILSTASRGELQHL